MLHDSTTARGLALARIWVYGMCLGDVARERTQEILGLPFGYYNRLGLLALAPDSARHWIYTASTLAAFKILLIAALALCLLGVRPFQRIAIPTCLLLILHHSIVLSSGHINHGELAMVYAACILALAPSADRLGIGRTSSIVRPPTAYSTPMVLIAFVFLLSYTFVGTHRLATSGVEIFRDGSILRYVLETGTSPGEYGRAFGLDYLTGGAAQFAFQAGFAYTTLMEILALFCLFSRRFRLLWVVSMLGFHFATLLLMQLFFFHNVVLMPLVMIDWHPWLQKLENRLALDR